MGKRIRRSRQYLLMGKTWEASEEFDNYFPDSHNEYLLMGKTWEVCEEFNSCFPYSHHFSQQRVLNSTHSGTPTARIQDVSVKLDRLTEKQLMKINKAAKAEKFYCIVCSKGYKCKGPFLNHCMKRHERYPCSRCLKMFRSKHNSRVHPCLDRSMYMCRVCPLSYQTKEEFTRHWSIHQGLFFCDLCLSAYDSKSNLERHSVIHENETYECEVCEKGFKALSTLNKHISTNHFSCNVCAELFPTKQEWEKHSNIHTNMQSLLQLDACESIQSTKDDLMNHNVIDFRIEEYSCNFCHESFNAKRLLNLHILDYHINKESKTALFTCDICAETYFKKKDLKEHFLTHTEEERERAIEVDQRSSSDGHKCPICLKSLGTQKMLSMHLDYHIDKESKTANFTCDICAETFFKKKDLKEHFLTHTEEECQRAIEVDQRSSSDAHKCPICSKSLGTQKMLSMHMLHFHGAGEIYLCRFCSETFKGYRELKEHALCHENDENNNQSWSNEKVSRVFCDFCSKSFESSNELGEHMLSVHGLWACGKVFSSVEDLVIHLVHHENGVEGQPREEDMFVKQKRQNGADHQECNQHQAQQQQNHAEQEQLAKQHLNEPCRRLLDWKRKLDSNGDDDQPLLQKQKLDSESSEETFLYSCPLCTRSFDKDDGLRHHMGYAHKARLYLCRIQKCFQKFFSLDSLNTHALNHHSDRPKQCELCSKLYASSCLLRHKRDFHRNERKPAETAKNKACSTLSSPPPSPSTRLKSPQPSTRLRSSPPASVSTATIYACTMCTNRYSSFSELSEHIRTNHSVGTQHICNVCVKIFATRSLMLNHVSRAHDRTKEQHVCHHCSISYSSVTALRMHLKDVHEEGRTEVCDKCSPPRKFSSTSSLKRHIQDIHSGGMQHPCKYCPRKYACWWSLVQHTRSVHEDSSLLCKLCQQGLGSVKGRNVVYCNWEELQKHISRQHPNAKENDTMEISWKRVKSAAGAAKREEVVDNDDDVVSEEEDEEVACSKCSEGFTSQDELRAHAEDHKKDRFSCNLCFRAFLTEDKLARHMTKCSLET